MHRTLVCSLAFVSCALATGSCTDTPSDTGDEPETGEEVQALTTAIGVDYSWAHPSPSALHNEGYSFAARYLSYTPSKNLTAGERDALWNAGVDVVVVWEASTDAALQGYGRGRGDAQAALAQANALGIPGDRPIYFAVDFDGTAGEQPALDSYFDGVASIIGTNRTGVYAGYYVVQRLFDHGKIAWGWQTYAWSYGHWDARAQVRQVHNGIAVGGSVCCDRDQAVADDYGQWHAQQTGTDGCTVQEDQNCAFYGCQCVNHQPNGGYCAGTGCTAVETHNAAFFGCNCVDHQPNGGYCPGTGCTAKETHDAAQFGCGCVDHHASGAFCPGTGCTAKETNDAAAFGCACVDHQGNGGFCPGTGCTAKETHDAAQYGCGCVDHQASGGFCAGTGCTAKETNDCSAQGHGCSLHQCT